MVMLKKEADFEYMHEGNGYSDGNPKGENIGFGLCMLIANTFSKENKIHFVMYEFGTESNT